MPVRRATESDAPELVRLAIQMFDSIGVDTSDPAWRAAALERAADTAWAPDAAAFVVDREDGGLGAAAAVTLARRMPTPTNPTGLNAYVQWVCTDPDRRGQGLGRAVMSALIEWCHAAGVTEIDLHSSEDGLPLYGALGFSTRPRPFLRLDRPR